MSARRLLAVVLLAVGCSSCTAPADDEGRSDARAAEVAAADGYQASVVECLRDNGWPVKTVEGGGGFAYDGEDPGPEVGAQYNAAVDECMVSAGPIPTFEPLEDTELRQLYALTLATAECVRAEGIHVAPAPSEDAFVAAHQAAGLGQDAELWDPYAEVPVAQFAAINRQCPQPSIQNL